MEPLCGLPKPLPEGSPIGRPLRAAPTFLKSPHTPLGFESYRLFQRGVKKGEGELSENEKGDCPFLGTVPFFGDMGKEEKEPFILEEEKAS